MRYVNASPVPLSAEWAVRRFTTDPPRYVWHAEWRVRMTVHSALDVRIIMLTREDDLIRWRKREPDAPTSFAVTSPFELPPDGMPTTQAWTALGSEPSLPRLGSLIPVLRTPAADWERAIIALDRKDTEGLRSHRWRPRLDVISDTVDLSPFHHGMAGQFDATQLTR